jgi:hypothetical protein
MPVSDFSVFSPIAPRVRMMVEGAACVLLGLMAARGAWLVVEPVGAVSQGMAMPSLQVTPPDTRLVADRFVLLQADAFPRGDLQTETVAPVTQLALTLRGFRISRGNDLVWSGAGLKAGAIVTAVTGASADVLDLTALMATVTAGNDVTLSLTEDSN